MSERRKGDSKQSGEGAFECGAVERSAMRSKMIKHNKDLFESIDDPMALLEKLHIY